MQTEYQTKRARNDDRSGECSAEIEWCSGGKVSLASIFECAHGLWKRGEWRLDKGRESSKHAFFQSSLGPVRFLGIDPREPFPAGFITKVYISIPQPECFQGRICSKRTKPKGRGTGRSVTDASMLDGIFCNPTPAFVSLLLLCPVPCAKYVSGDQRTTVLCYDYYQYYFF